jgi:hypothetical protein
MSAYMTAPAMTKRDFRLWIPLPLVCLLFLPVLALLLPALAVSCAVARANFQRTLGMFLELLWSLRGTQVQLAVKQLFVSVHIA